MNYRACKRGLKIIEVPIHFAERSEGESKMSLRIQLESALMPVLLRFRRTVGMWGWPARSECGCHYLHPSCQYPSGFALALGP